MILSDLKLPQIRAITPIIETGVFQIEAVDLQFHNGQRRSFERFVCWPEGVIMVVPLLNSDTILLIREYCVGVHDYVLTLPKGKVDQGEKPFEAANRELQEEIGYGARQLHLLRTLTNSPSYSGTRMHIMVAQDLYPSRLIGDEPEPIEVVPWPIAKIPELIMRDEFSEGRAIAALYLAQLYLANR